MTDLTEEQIAEMKGAAEKTTPGPWFVSDDINGRPLVRGPGMWSVTGLYHTPDGRGEANAAFIALANPATVLALLEERERLRKFAAWCLSPDFDSRNVSIFARAALQGGGR